MGDISKEDVESEFLALESIYENRLTHETTDKGNKVKIIIYPATADNVSSQYVFLEVLFDLPQSYPSTTPEVIFTKSRGLSDTRLSQLKEKMVEFAKERIGECILFDLIEIVKDVLTSNNVPHCPCPICLTNFHECDDFLKTECYHYFHSYCMNRYFVHQLEDTFENAKERKKYLADTDKGSAPCPVCRLSISLNIQTLQEAQPPLNEETFEIDTVSNTEHVRKFAEQYKKQLENGGLIDLEYEKDKFLLSNIEQVYISQNASIPETSRTCNELNDSVSTESNHDLHVDGSHVEKKLENDEKDDTKCHQTSKQSKSQKHFNNNRRYHPQHSGTYQNVSQKSRFTQRKNHNWYEGHRPSRDRKWERKGKGKQGLTDAEQKRHGYKNKDTEERDVHHQTGGKSPEAGHSQSYKHENRTKQNSSQISCNKQRERRDAGFQHRKEFYPKNDTATKGRKLSEIHQSAKPINAPPGFRKVIAPPPGFSNAKAIGHH